MMLILSVYLLCLVICIQHAVAYNSNACLNVSLAQNEKPKQIVFVHIYKTGGSTMREVFREYGQKCGYSTAVIVRCDKDANLDGVSVTERTILPCQIKSFVGNGNALAVRPAVGMVKKRGTLAFASQFDIIVGHLPHGLFKYVSNMALPADKPGSAVVDQAVAAVSAPRGRVLVTWLRHPLSMIISSCLYLINKNQGEKKLVKTSYDDVVAKIHVKMERPENIIAESGAYSQFIKYLLPGGLTAASKMGEQKVLDFIEGHLQEYSVIGILENHKQSMQMLKHTIDSTISLKQSWWDEMATMKRNAVNAGKKAAKAAESKANSRALKDSDSKQTNEPQVISTDSIRRYIESNSTLLAHIENVLRLEYKIYDKALLMHNAQCKALAEQFSEMSCVV